MKPASRLGIFVFFVLLSAAGPLSAEVVDRIVATVGGEVVTWTELESEARYRAFRAGEAPASESHENLGSVESAEDSEPTIEALIDRVLLEQALRRSPFEVPQDESVIDPYEQLSERFATREDLRAELDRHGISELELRQRLAGERRLVLFVNYALGPQVRLQPEAIEAFYRETLIPELERQDSSAQVPPLDEVRGRIRDILTQREINTRLDQWVADLRRTTKIRIYDR